MSGFSKIVDEIIAEMGDLSPVEINTGECQEFAERFVKKVGGKIYWNDEINHAFVKYKGKFYDAEAPEGVSRWEDLPIYDRAMDWYDEYDKRHGVPSGTGKKDGALTVGWR